MLIKRTFDMVIATIGLILLSPLLLLVGLAILLFDGTPVFFLQARVGRDGEEFFIRKFRTMRSSSAGTKISASSDSRVTPVGRFLRRSKLDELPQLINVLEGSMSLVGPRPEVPEFARYWSEEERRVILSVRPGVTDPASVEFRNESDLLDQVDDPERYYVDVLLPKKASAYVQYVRSRTTVGDLRIILDTARVVIFGDSGSPSRN